MDDVHFEDLRSVSTEQEYAVIRLSLVGLFDSAPAFIKEFTLNGRGNALEFAPNLVLAVKGGRLFTLGEYLMHVGSVWYFVALSEH